MQPDLSEYRSIYQHRETKEKVRVRRVETSSYMVLLPDGNRVSMTQFTLKKAYRFVKNSRATHQGFSYA